MVKSAVNNIKPWIIRQMMKNLIIELEKIAPDILDLIAARLEQFSSFSNKANKYWFSELCFCILTANSKAESGMAIQEDLGPAGFCNYSEKDIRDCIIKHKHRFHNNKARFIMGAREHMDIKKKITAIAEKKGEPAARQWLVDNISGLGYKEASHFMRNVGFFSLSILDRHILRGMKEYSIIDDIPKTLTRKKYMEIEIRFIRIADETRITPAELDLRMWYLRTGRVLK